MYRHRTDIVIPLGTGSCRNNFELRMALRSIARYAVNAGNIYIAASALPDWVCQVKTLLVPDRHKHNKDANIIEKILAAVNLPELSENFVFWSDDQLALNNFDAGNLPISCNPRQYKDFDSKKIWHRRMRNTFDYLLKNNIKLNCNFDSHVPVTMQKTLFKKIMQDADYTQEPGYCINTLYYGMAGLQGGIKQKVIKYTAESSKKLNCLPLDKLFLGYNDAAMQSDLPQLLQEHFKEKCKYEK